MNFIKRAEKLFMEASRFTTSIKNPKDFGPLSTKILENSSIHEHFNKEVVSEFFKLKILPKQNYTINNFSDSAFTLFRNDQFFLDIYFWRNSDTDLHSHHFTGAFKMLSGVQRQTTYSFIKKKKITAFLEQGELKLLQSKVLQVGDTQPILLGDNFIHQIIHDKNELTVNLCLRTPAIDPLKFYGFFLPGHKLENLPYSDLRSRKLSLIDSLPEKLKTEALQNFLNTCDLFTLVNLAIGPQLNANNMSDLIKHESLINIKLRFPKAYLKLSPFLLDSAKHLKMHKKLKYFQSE